MRVFPAFAKCAPEILLLAAALSAWSQDNRYLPNDQQIPPADCLTLHRWFRSAQGW